MLSLKDLKFGKTDAFNELKEFGEDWFLAAFFPYEKYQIENFINGSSYYICGEKGTGKTALLRYLQCKLAACPTNLILPIRFKTDLDNEDKKALMRAAGNVKETMVDKPEETRDNIDTALMWQIFIIYKIFEASNDGEYELFERSKELGEINQLLKVIYPEFENQIFPKLKHGQLNVSANVAKMLDAQLQLEIGFDNTRTSIDFVRVAKSILSKFQRLTFGQGKAYVLFDELELSIRSVKDHQRDICLVRDLILAIDRLNEICKTKCFDIHVIASIRTEVIKSVHSVGYEINKSIEDYGIILSWYQKGGNYDQNKLLKLIENKIIACEEMNGIMEHGDVWQQYFPETINGIETKRYILNYSWLHPRDIVRMMNHVLQQVNGETKFTQELFDRAMNEYSSKSWVEITEGLSLKYSAQHIAAIKRIFTNIEVPFTYSTLTTRIDGLSAIDSDVSAFYEHFNLREVLDDLFDYGVIGNSGQRMIFKFMGYDDLALTEDMIIHKPLRNFFGVKSRRKAHVDMYE